MARSEKSKEIVNAVSRLLVRGGYNFAGYVMFGKSSWGPDRARRKRFIFKNTGQRASVGPRTTFFYSIETEGTVKVKSVDLAMVGRVMVARKAAVGYHD